MALTVKPGDILFLDTAPFIYYFQQHPDHFPPLEALFDQIYHTNAQAITSVVTYIELTTQPVRQGLHRLARKYHDYLSNSDNISVFPLDLDIADHVVDIRARHGFKTPDAIQIGTAVACGADVIITNDRAWKRFEAIPVILVAELQQ